MKNDTCSRVRVFDNIARRSMPVIWLMGRSPHVLMHKICAVSVASIRIPFPFAFRLAILAFHVSPCRISQPGEVHYDKLSRHVLCEDQHGGAWLDIFTSLADPAKDHPTSQAQRKLHSQGMVDL